MLLLTTVVLFGLSATLFVVTTRRRDQLDLALKRAAADRSGVENPRQLGSYEAWKPNDTFVALNQPERRWTYDQAYMATFVNALLSQRVPIAAAAKSASVPLGGTALEYYKGPILILDIWFAVTFAAFIVCGGTLAAEHFVWYAWVHHLFTVAACLGAVYGAADVAEDVKLRSILGHARTVTGLSGTDSTASAASGDADVVDAGEIDAANALTRIKMVTIVASIVGFFAFCLLLVASHIVVRISGRPPD
jgi:hypothetical protein